ncbi:MAG: helix-turn-helix domain-containing protein [Lachnospiraceae bacterium]
MNSLRLSGNIARLRKERSVTQDELANFLGVTKASVSKWENGQSMPDILLLPQLASYFDVTIDVLLGYEPQLTKEQMQKIYLELATAFAKEPFEEVMERSQKLAKKYYSCYPFLYQVVLLYLNHFMLAKGQERQQEILETALHLCDHILADCKEISICNETVVLRAMVLLFLNRAKEIIDSLEGLLNPVSPARQSASVLIKAYQSVGDMEKADSFTQISMYNEVLALVEGATEYMAIHSDNLQICEETIRRVNMVAEAFDLIHLNANSIALFWYQAAIIYCMQGNKEKALVYLQRFADAIGNLLTKEVPMLQGDSYFTMLDSWIQESEFSGNLPRDKKVIWDSAIQALEHPALSLLEKEEAFIKIKQELIHKRDME